MTKKNDNQENSQKTGVSKKEITEQNRTPQIFKNEENVYRALIEYSNDAVSIGKDGKRIYANKKFLEVFGYDNLDEVLGKPLTTVVHSDDHQMVSDYSNRRLKGEAAPSRYEFKGIRKNGEQIYIEISSARAVVSGESILLASMRDITQRKQMEEELINAKKIESTGMLVGGIAHDFNNLLSVVLGNIAIVKEMDQSQSGIEKYLNEAEEAAQQVRDLVKKLSSFSKENRVVKKSTSIGKLVKETAEKSIDNAKIKMNYSIPDNLWMIKVDEKKIKDVINNVIRNAAQAMQNAGTINIKLENNKHTPKGDDQAENIKEGKYVKISIQDHGPGISQEIVSRVFDPYYSTQKRGSQKGMGLGLATAYSIVKKHGGEIVIHTKKDIGTTLDIYLPFSV